MLFGLSILLQLLLFMSSNGVQLTYLYGDAGGGHGLGGGVSAAVVTERTSSSD